MLQQNATSQQHERATDTDHLVTHLRKKVLNQQIELARLQAATGNDAMAYRTPLPGGQYGGGQGLWREMNAMRPVQMAHDMNSPTFGSTNEQQLTAAAYMARRASLATGNGQGQPEKTPERVAADPPGDKDEEDDEEYGNPSGPSRCSEEIVASRGYQNHDILQRLNSINSDPGFFPGIHALNLPGQSGILQQILAQRRHSLPDFGRRLSLGAEYSNLALGGGRESWFSSSIGAAYRGETSSGEGTGGMMGGSAHNGRASGREPVLLSMTCDEDDLSPYQILVRKQIELFEASTEDTESNARGRNRPIVLGQVGIRCRHCKVVPPKKRERAAVYYPSKLDRLYQAGQTMASIHLGQNCKHIPEPLRKELAKLREGKSAALSGKKYWSDAAKAIGIYQDSDRLFFSS